MNKEKYQYIKDNINYILGPFYIINQKNGVVSISYQKLRKMPNELLKILADFLIDDTSVSETELYQYIKKCNNKSSEVFLGAKEFNIRVSDQREKCYYLLLDNIKKHLNKTNNQEGLQILLKYYKIKS